MSLDILVAPEIVNDGLYYAIKNIASKPNVVNILEIGSSTGEGSTKAFFEGMSSNPQAILFCLEISQRRFSKLCSKYSNSNRVFCFNMSSISIKDFLTEEQVIGFYNSHHTNLNRYPLNVVLGWLKQDVDYIINKNIPENGIDHIKSNFGIKTFDAVLIDGSAFTGEVEFSKVYGAKYLIFDDIIDIKNGNNHKKLLEDSDYKLILSDIHLRNGFSIFERVS